MKKDKTYQKEVFRCSCGVNKFLTIDVFYWEDEPTEYFMSISYEPYSLWYRLKLVWELLVKGKCYTHEVLLEKEDWERLKKLLK